MVIGYFEGFVVDKVSGKVVNDLWYYGVFYLRCCFKCDYDVVNCNKYYVMGELNKLKK